MHFTFYIKTILRYTKADMERALNMVQAEGYAVARAAEECGVPRVTLLDAVKKTHKTGVIGRPTVLSAAEEAGLVKVLVQMAKYNYPVTRRHLVDMVKDYMDKNRTSRKGSLYCAVLVLPTGGTVHPYLSTYHSLSVPTVPYLPYSVLYRYVWGT